MWMKKEDEEIKQAKNIVQASPHAWGHFASDEFIAMQQFASDCNLLAVLRGNLDCDEAVAASARMEAFYNSISSPTPEPRPSKRRLPCNFTPRSEKPKPSKLPQASKLPECLPGGT